MGALTQWHTQHPMETSASSENGTDYTELPDFDLPGGDEFGEFDDTTFDDIAVDFDSGFNTNPLLALPGPRGSQYIFEDELNSRRMSWADRFTWLLGSTFLIGGGMGGTYGLLQGYRTGRGRPRRLL